jgi:hypothetical protein
MSTVNKPVTALTDYWHCECRTRDPQGNLSQLRLNHPLVKRCRRCQATKPNGKK